MKTPEQDRPGQQIFDIFSQTSAMTARIDRRVQEVERTGPTHDFKLRKQVGELLLPHVAEKSMPPMGTFALLARSLGSMAANRAELFALGVAQDSLTHYYTHVNGQLDELLAGKTITSRLTADVLPGQVYGYRDSANHGTRSGLGIEQSVISGPYHHTEVRFGTLHIQDAEIEDKVWQIRLMRNGEPAVELDIV